MKLSLRRLPLFAQVFMKSCADGTCSLRLQAAANSKSTPPTLMAPANRECRIGCIPFLWPSVGATNPPIEEVDPTIVFDRAFDSEQSVGPDFDQRRIAFINPEMGCALLDQIWCCRQIQMALRKNKNDINRSCRTGCVPVHSFRRRRDEASNRGSRPTIDFDAAFWRRADVGGRFRPAAPRLLSIQGKWDAPCRTGKGTIRQMQPGLRKNKTTMAAGHVGL